jgi:hypothetical protein
MEMIREIDREFTETKTRMVKEEYQETSVETVIVLEVKLKTLRDFIYTSDGRAMGARDGERIWAEPRLKKLFGDVWDI